MDDVLTGLRAAAEPTRLRLLALCAHGDLTVSDLTQILGQSQPRVSRHLKLLCDAGLLERFPEGAWVFYRLTRQGVSARISSSILDLLPREDPVLALDRERLAAIKQARAEDAAAYFRINAARWDTMRSLYVEETEVEKNLLELLDAKLGSVSRDDLLDVGTGTGRMLQLFAPRVRNAVGIDSSREMLALARSGLDRAGVRNALVRQGSLYQLPWAAPSFDVVVIHQVLHYVDHPEQALLEAARVLRPGGQLVVVDFAPHDQEFLRSEHNHHRLGFSDDEVLQWFSNAHLSPLSTRKLPGSPLTVVLWLAERSPDNATF